VARIHSFGERINFYLHTNYLVTEWGEDGEAGSIIDNFLRRDLYFPKLVDGKVEMKTHNRTSLGKKDFYQWMCQ